MDQSERLTMVHSFNVGTRDGIMATSFWSIFAHLADPTPIRCTGFRNGLQYHNSDFRTLNGKNISTLYRDLVIFCHVTKQFTTFECVKQASIVALV